MKVKTRSVLRFGLLLATAAWFVMSTARMLGQTSSDTGGRAAPAPSAQEDLSKYRLELLLEAQRINLENYARNEWSTSTLLLIAIGWLLTSTKARDVLHSTPDFRRAGLIAIAVIALLHVVLLLQLVLQSEAIYTRLRSERFVELAELGAEHFGPRVTWLNFGLSVAVDEALFLVLFLLVVWTRSPGAAGKSTGGGESP